MNEERDEFEKSYSTKTGTPVDWLVRHRRSEFYIGSVTLNTAWEYWQAGRKHG